MTYEIDYTNFDPDKDRSIKNPLAKHTHNKLIAWKYPSPEAMEIKVKALRKAMIGKKQSPESCALRSAKMRGIKWSDDVIKRRSETHCIPVSQFDKDGNWITDWDSQKQAITELDLDARQFGKCLRKTLNRKCGECYWRLKDGRKSIADELEEFKLKVTRNRKPSVPIIQMNLKEEIIKEWPSAKIASIALKIASGSISTCVNGKTYSAGGFLWKRK